MPNEPLQGTPLPRRANADADVERSHEQPRWYDDPANPNRILYLLVGISVILLLIDPLISKHGALAIERLWGFYGLFGLVAGVVLVLVAGLLRRIVMRPEDYYDR